jgi:hypothetical protein
VDSNTFFKGRAGGQNGGPSGEFQTHGEGERRTRNPFKELRISISEKVQAVQILRNAKGLNNLDKSIPNVTDVTRLEPKNTLFCSFTQ